MEKQAKVGQERKIAVRESEKAVDRSKAFLQMFQEKNNHLSQLQFNWIN